MAFLSKAKKNILFLCQDVTWTLVLMIQLHLVKNIA